MSQPPPSTDTPPYTPTRIRRLYVRGYRSIRELDLVDLPSIVVLHGENGAGKSNILRAMALPLRWLAGDGPIAGTREASVKLDYVTADAQLGIRRDDFHAFSGHEMRFLIEVELGSRARSSIRELAEDARLTIDVVVQDVGDGIRWWASQAQIGEELSLVSTHRGSIDPSERARGEKALLLDRIRTRLLRRELMRVSEAYRRVSREPIGTTSDFGNDTESLLGTDQVQRRLYLLATSSDARKRAVLPALAKRLSVIMADGGDGESIDLAAVRNDEFREYEMQRSSGSLEGIPLTSLGTGEQQLLMLLLDVLVAVTPIVQIQEPEAHLHKRLMFRLARLLETLVEEHDIDQLFLETHHHAFAIAPQYYDITYDDEHGTRAVLTNRARAIDHFYEPGPLWEALRSLVASGLQDDAVIFRDESGAPKRAREILASIKEEGPLAKKFAEEMTKTILLSMREEAEFGDS